MNLKIRFVALITLMTLLPLCSTAQEELVNVRRGDCTPGINDNGNEDGNGPRRASRRLPAIRTNWDPNKTYKQMVVLFEFSDSTFQREDANATYNRIFNEPHYNESAGPGSVADYFRVRFDIQMGGQTYAAIGNRFLLNHPQKQQVQLSRRLTDEGIQQAVDHHLALSKRGYVLVSPAISKGEQAVMRAALDARQPLIFITPWGFNDFSHPGHQYYEACAEGRFLILAPWPHQNRRIPLTRDMCLSLNDMAKNLCSPNGSTAATSYG